MTKHFIMKNFTVRAAFAAMLTECFAKKTGVSELMRITMLYLVCFLSSVQLLVAKAGKGQPAEEVRITLELKNETLEGAFKKIEKKTDYLFAYQPQLVAPYKNISLAKGNRTVFATLELILKGTILSFRQVNSNIVIFEKDKPRQEIENNNLFASNRETFTKVITGKIVDEAGQPMAGVSVSVK